MTAIADDVRVVCVLVAAVDRVMLADALSHADRHPSVRCSTRAAGDPVDGTAHGVAAPLRFDATIEAVGAAAGLADRVGPTVGAVADLLDLSRCAVVAGVQHTVWAGAGSMRNMMTLRRRVGMTAGEFAHEWLHVHGQLVAEGSSGARTYGYRQLHADGELSADIALRLGFGGPRFDGIAEADQVDAAQFARFLHGRFAAAALADEARFIDHASSGIFLLDDA